eukprot:jgi/Tetstr1/453445/TSEL_040426.t1
MIRNGVRISLKNGPPAPFYQGVSMEDATPDQLRFMDSELARFLASGAWEEGHCSRDLHDGFYAVGIAPEDRDYFTVGYRGKLYRLAGLLMELSLSPYTTYVLSLRHSAATCGAPTSQ